MQERLEKLFKVVEQVKTPLSLAGAVLIVFYLLLQQVLNLRVFENIGSSSTAILLHEIVQYLFWLALISILLGFASYVVAIILNHQLRSRESDVQLIDARLDPQTSNYEEHEQNGVSSIRPSKRKKGKTEK